MASDNSDHEYFTEEVRSPLGEVGALGALLDPQRDSEDGVEDMSLAGSPGVSATTFNLQPVQIGDDVIRIRYGVCHGIVPKIDDGGATEITADLDDADNPEITVTASGKLYIKVDLATDTYEAENPVIEYAATVPDDVDRVSAHHELADVTWDSADGGSITLIVPVHGGNIDMASCGGVINYWDLNA